jgi:hypothetical protein
MLRFYAILVLIIVLFINASKCSVSSSSIPDHWENNMRISYFRGGGMVNESESINVYNDSVIHVKSQNGLELKAVYTFTKAELDELIHVFHENKFESIQSVKTGMVYDKPGTSIQLCIGTKCYEKGDGATETFEGDDALRRKAVIAKLLSMVHAKTIRQSKAFVVEMDESVIKSSKDLHYQIEPGNYTVGSAQNGKEERHEYQLTEGKYRVIAYFYTQLATGGTKYETEAMDEFDTKQTKGIRFKAINDKLIIEKINH